MYKIILNAPCLNDPPLPGMKSTGMPVNLSGREDEEAWWPSLYAYRPYLLNFLETSSLNGIF